jgi:acyl carrier protein
MRAAAPRRDANRMGTELEEEIRGFIVGEVLQDEEFADLAVDAPLLSGVLDSFALVTIVEFLEDRFDLTIGAEEMVKDNFRSVAAIASYIRSRRVAGSPRGAPPLPHE